MLEKDRSWREEEFDFVLQTLRTVLLKRKVPRHLTADSLLTSLDGASLIYTTPSVTSPLQGLIHSSLGIHSLLKRQPLKHNVIDRDKVLVPPNWDSWGKIRVLRDGFDVEAINKGWSSDIEESTDLLRNGTNGTSDTNDHTMPDEAQPLVAGGAVSTYQETIRDPSLDAVKATTSDSNGFSLDVKPEDTQDFLASQVGLLEQVRQGAEPGTADSRAARGRHASQSVDEGDGARFDEGRVSEHIGPVQFNMGGIQVDADDMLQRLKVCSPLRILMLLLTSDRIAKAIKHQSQPRLAV